MTTAQRRKDGSALWHLIEQTLADEIAGGQPTVGGRLPTEPALMARFGVSRATVRQAIASLETRGLVRAEQGRGTFVHRDVVRYPVSRHTRYSRNLIEQGFEPGGTVIAQEIVAADTTVAAALRLPRGAPVIRRKAIGTADGVPIEVASTFLPADRFPDFDRIRTQHATLTATLAAYGIVDYTRVSTTVGARPPTAEEARLLRQPRSAPILDVTKLDADAGGAPIVYGRAAWSAERVVFELACPT